MLTRPVKLGALGGLDDHRPHRDLAGRGISGIVAGAEAWLPMASLGCPLQATCPSGLSCSLSMIISRANL